MPASLSDGHAKKRINNNGKELKINFLRQLFSSAIFFLFAERQKIKFVSRKTSFTCPLF